MSLATPIRPLEKPRRPLGLRRPLGQFWPQTDLFLFSFSKILIRGRQFKKVFSYKAVLDTPDTTYKSFRNESARVVRFEQLSFNKVYFTASNFEAAVGLHIEAAGKMKVATRVLDHRTIQNHFV